MYLHLLLCKMQIEKDQAAEGLVCSFLEPTSALLCPALDSPLQVRHCKVQEISKAPQRWLRLKHLPGEQRLRGPREAVKSHLGHLKNQMDEMLNNLILAGLSLRKVLNQMVFRVHFQS